MQVNEHKIVFLKEYDQSVKKKKVYKDCKEKGFAISVKTPNLYKKPQNLKENYDMVPPQSFAYLR